MMPDTPSAILARAADLIRDTAAAAAGAPWTVQDDDSERYIDGMDDRWVSTAARSVGKSCGCCSVGTIDSENAAGDDGFKVTIKADVGAAVDALTRVIYRFHPPRDVDEGAICDVCVEPWPCPRLREFEQQRMNARGGGDA